MKLTRKFGFIFVLNFFWFTISSAQAQDNLYHLNVINKIPYRLSFFTTGKFFFQPQEKYLKIGISHFAIEHPGCGVITVFLPDMQYDTCQFRMRSIKDCHNAECHYLKDTEILSNTETTSPYICKEISDEEIEIVEK